MISWVWYTNYSYWLEKNLIMKYTTNNTSPAFTLIELIVAITIFGVIMISVMSVFLFASQMSARVEVQRIMQENIKNVVEDIAEWVRKSGLSWVLPDGGIDACSWSWAWLVGTKLCLNNGTQYSIWYIDSWIGSWVRSTDINGDCWDIKSSCHVLKKDTAWWYYPLSNSFIHFEDISFVIVNSEVPKLLLNITVRPSSYKSLPSAIVKNNKVHIQTTFSERLIKTY